MFEYPSALILIIVAFYALYRLPSRLFPFLVLGAIPPLAVVMGYNFAAYHNPFTTGYGCNDTYWKGECTGIGGFSLPPQGIAAYDLSLSPYRGLFFLSPFLLLAFPGYALWFVNRRREVVDNLVCLAIPVTVFVAICCYWGYNGGTAVGPRYLTQLVPFLTLPIIFVPDRMRSTASRLPLYALMLASFVNVWVETIGGHSYPSGSIKQPLFAYSFPNLLKGQVPLDIGFFFGIRGLASVFVLAALAMVWTFIVSVPAHIELHHVLRQSRE